MRIEGLRRCRRRLRRWRLLPVLREESRRQSRSSQKSEQDRVSVRHVETPLLQDTNAWLLLFLHGRGPLAVVFRHLHFDLRVAWLYRECAHLDSLRAPAAAGAPAAQPLAIGNEHDLRTIPKKPVAQGRNEAHQELVPGLERVLGPAIPERVTRTDCLDAPGLLFTLVVLQGEIDLDMGIGPYVLRHRRLRCDAVGVVVDT